MTDSTSVPDPSGRAAHATPDAHTAGSDPRWRITPTKWLAGAVLLVGIVVPLLVATYARDEPRLFGFPFFYWYQLMWVFLAAGLCGLAFWLLKRERDAYGRRPDDGRLDNGRGAGR